MVTGVPAFAWAVYGVWSLGGWAHWAVAAWLLVGASSIPTYRRTFRLLRAAEAALAANDAVSA